ncbi:MAG: general secretion pathway protein GspB [Mariprofundaceae bacterium]|nr:general secretion pathway protein GspB [Mariprofundaceae bacterium]
MSFLLDALKKSEQERQDVLPNLQTKHATYTQKKWPWLWISLLSLAILLNVALFFWFYPSTTPKQTIAKQPMIQPPITQQKTIKKQQAIVPEQEQKEETISLPFSHLKDAPIAQATPSKAFIEKNKQPMRLTPEKSLRKQVLVTKNTTMTLNDLSPQQRKKIGHVNISAHFFNEQATDRIVMINGDTKHEGQWVHPELQIIAITSQGVLLKHQQLVFSMEAFQELKP